MKSNKVFFTHFEVNHNFKSFKNKGHVTIAGIFDKDKKELKFAASFCSPKDRFVKKVGRDLASKRLLEGGESCMTISNIELIKETKLYNICSNILWLMRVDKRFPKWIDKNNLFDWDEAF